MAGYVKGGHGSPSIVCIGGGTGLSTMLRGLKKYTENITAICTVADDGGGSGVLREELGMLPPGDIRNCILALADIEPIMDRLFNYRFDSGHLKGQSFGNLFLAAMNGICPSFDVAVSEVCSVLAITGRVLPVTNEDVHLAAEFDDGSEVLGESKIFAAKKERGCRIKKVKLIPEEPKALPDSVLAIEEADMIILGPGSLYTSIIPNLLVDGISEAIFRSKALKMYVCNVMTQDGETEGYSVSDHIKALFRHSKCKIFDICLANNLAVPGDLQEKYARAGQSQLFADIGEIKKLGVEVYQAPISGGQRHVARHDPELLAKEIMKIYTSLSPTREYGRR